MDLRLVNAGQGDLNRIFNAAQIFFRRIQGTESAIERKRLAAAGWPGDQNQPLRLRQRGAEQA